MMWKLNLGRDVPIQTWTYGSDHVMNFEPELKLS
jgi:hypothetical protein